VWRGSKAPKEAGLGRLRMCGFPRGLSGCVVRTPGGVAAKGAKPMIWSPMKGGLKVVKPKAYIGFDEPM